MSGNQYKPDPRQALFLKYYLDPKSETFSNAIQSGLKAGFSEEYSKVILSKDLDWMSESINTGLMVQKAEKNLQNMLDMEVLKDDVDTGKLKIKADVSKFVAERLAKDKYSQKQVTEHTGKVELVDNSELDKLADILDEKNKKKYEN